MLYLSLLIQEFTHVKITKVKILGQFDTSLYGNINIYICYQSNTIVSSSTFVEIVHFLKVSKNTITTVSPLVCLHVHHTTCLVCVFRLDLSCSTNSVLTVAFESVSGFW